MTAKLHVHGFDTSNNMKVRVGLGFKEIDYVWHAIDPSDRSQIEEWTGQFLTPILEHGGVRLFDSAAILRYLDANFPGTPRLFGTTRDEQWEIDELELFARTALANPMYEVVHRKIKGLPVDDERMERCGGEFDRALASIAQRLGGRDWLVGDRMTVADITSACVLRRIRGSGLLPLPAAAEPLRAWEDRVLHYDGRCRQDA